MKNIPLFYYPTTWVWVDDNKTMLDTMAMVFGENNPVKPFSSPIDCLSFLKAYQSPLKNFAFLKSNTDDELYGTLQSTPVNFDITTIINIAEEKKRHEEISIAIIDYEMPEMCGLELAKAIKDMPMMKVLLTGKAAHNETVTGFNQKLIDYYIKKGESSMADELNLRLTQLSLDYFSKKTNQLLKHLETENSLPLSDDNFIKFFKNYCDEHSITEYYLIDKQGSFLCINAMGDKFYLVVHTDNSINQWLEIYAEELHSSNDLDAIKARELIPFFGPGKEGFEIDLSNWRKHFYRPKIMPGNENYYYTIIKVEE